MHSDQESMITTSLRMRSASVLFAMFLGSTCMAQVCSTGVGGDWIVSVATTINTDTGVITPPGGVSPAFDGTAFNFVNIDIQSGASVSATGVQPLILLATGDAMVRGALIASGADGESVIAFNLPGGAGGAGGPGGGTGGGGGGLAPGTGILNGGMGAGPGGGVGAVCNDVTSGGAGGGGGGHAAMGSAGGTGSPSIPGAGGISYASLPPLVGGSGGGGGSADDDNAPIGGAVVPASDDGAAGGGGGGGAVRIAAAGIVTIVGSGSIDCSGGDGGDNHVAGVDGGGGGGGSGGSIELIGSVLPTVAGTLNVAAGALGGSAPGIGGASAAGRTNLVASPCGPPPPTCTLAVPAGTLSASIVVTIDSASSSSAMIDATYEFSIDMGATWQTCTAAASSPTLNPAIGIATGMQTFHWDSRADGVGIAALATGVLMRATINDGVALMFGICATMPFDVDNTALCGGICGDCDENGAAAPTVLDALLAAQISAGLLVPSPTQIGCCDVDFSMTIAVIDALLIAQVGVGVPVVLMCP